MHERSRHALRLNHRTIRRAQSKQFQQQASAAVIAHIKSLPLYARAQRIAFYHAIDGEVNVDALCVDAQNRDCYCYLPRLNANKTLAFLPITAHTPLTINKFGIPEPDVCLEEATCPTNLDLMLVPMVAFDPHGTRLGRGGGYYDRTLANARPKCVLGVAYAFQYQTYIEPEPWDEPLNGVVTEQGVCWMDSH